MKKFMKILLGVFLVAMIFLTMIVLGCYLYDTFVQGFLTETLPLWKGTLL